MQFTKLSLQNLRAFETLSLPLDKQLTLLHGSNGSGKTTVVDAVTHALAEVLPKEHNEPPRTLGSGDTRRTYDTVTSQNPDLPGLRSLPLSSRWSGSLTVELHYQLPGTKPDDDPKIHLSISRSGERTANSRALGALRRAVTGDVHKKPERHASASPVPVFAVYRAQRAWKDSGHVEELRDEPTAGWHNCLDAGASIGGLRAWWRDKDHKGVRAGQFSPELIAVQQAIARLLGEGVRDPAYNPADGIEDVMFHLPRLGGVFALRELSDGYRGLVSLAADLARRASLLNPHLGAQVLEEVPGFVIIDEVDLHLHPSWQLDVVPSLLRMFPRFQWLITTHSALVVAGARPDQVVRLQTSPDHGTQVSPRTYDPRLMTPAELFRFYFGIDDVYPTKEGQAMRTFSRYAEREDRTDAQDSALREACEVLNKAGILLPFPAVDRTQGEDTDTPAEPVRTLR